jgi:hypothetical protein
VSLFSDDALKRSDDVARSAYSMQARSAALRHVTKQGARFVPLTHVGDTTYTSLDS